MSRIEDSYKFYQFYDFSFQLQANYYFQKFTASTIYMARYYKIYNFMLIQPASTGLQMLQNLPNL